MRPREAAGGAAPLSSVILHAVAGGSSLVNGVGASWRRCMCEVATSPVGSALLSGGLAGCIAKTLVAPLSRLTVLAQTSSLLASKPPGHVVVLDRRIFVEKGIAHGVKHIIHREGVLALWRGNGVTCMHRFWFTGIKFAVVEYCQDQRVLGSSARNRCVAGGVASCLAVLICYPLDLVRTRIMAGCPGGAVRSLANVLQKEGVRGAYRGAGAAVLVTSPPVAVSFGSYGPLKDCLERHAFPSNSFTATAMAGGVSGVAGSALVFPIDVLRRRLQLLARLRAGDGKGLPICCHALPRV